MEDIVGIKPLGLRNNADLTVIIPFKYTNQREDILERISFCKLDRNLPNNIDFLLVDDCTELDISEQAANICKELGISYMRLDSDDLLFSAARARNYGAMYGLSPFIMFMDIDLVVYDGFYQDALEEIKFNDLENNVRDFIGFGVIYLTKHGSELFFKTERTARRKQFLQHFLINNEEVVEKFSTGTSVQIFNREYYLSRGGNNEEFAGWGFEDLEFTCRLAHRAKHFPLPQNFLQDYKNCRDVVEYNGFKSLIRLYGDITFAKGISLFHIWHEVNNSSSYMKRKQKNRVLFNKLLKSYIERKEEPEPLPDLSQGNSLIFTLTHPAIYNREVLPRYGKIFYEEEERFKDISYLEEYLKDNNINRVILQNPYSNEIRLKIYNFLRERKVEYFVIERGALPNSMFFDRNGFNADSKSYNSENWDFEISEEKREAVLNYISEEKSNDAALEDQSERIATNKLLRQLKINPGKKVLFVPFQTPSDTVIKFFCGIYIKTYAEFVELVRSVAKSLPKNWVLVYKKHPLTKEGYEVAGGIEADDYNIKDLLNIADCILLINSGVGVLSMLWEKPVLYTGEAFYAHDAFNRRVKNQQEVISHLNNLFVPDKERIFRFLSYLINDFYSFGNFTTKVIDWSLESKMTITSEINFYQINNIGKTKYIYNPIRTVKIDNKSVLFDRYRFSTDYKLRQGTGLIGRPIMRNNTERRFVIVRRLRKLINNPHNFFEDSRFIFLRPLRYLFK
ncbi:hypothetical protein H1Q59_02215 [Holosporaceae bacterium 'Namur']|nr:hypothetical protein [Holosporaceae bacterium 'Namur']